MTVNSTTRKAGPYLGNGTTITFPFSFKVYANSDVTVVRTDPNGVESNLVMGTDYSVSLNSDQNSNPGGNISMLTGAPAIGYLTTLTSSMAYTQTLDLTNLGGFYPKTINDALDRQEIQIQQLAEQVGRSVKTGISSSVTPEQLIDTLTTNVNNAIAAAETATTEAGIATSKASDSANSATASANSANSSNNSASIAATKASEAASYSASTAALLASFRSVMLGAFASDSAAASFASANSISLVDGVMYENTTGTPNKFRIYNGATWDDYDSSAQVSQSAAALSAANAASSAAAALTSKNNAATSETNSASSATAAAASASAAAATKVQVDNSLAYVSSITSYKLSVLKNGGSASQIVQINGSTLPVGNRAGATINVSLTS